MRGMSEIEELRGRIEVAEKYLRILAEDWGKQRAMNMELLDFLARTAAPLFRERLDAAIRETLKP
jgi:hypothetical protein